MSSAEYRLWICVPDLPFEAEARWEKLIAHLEQAHGELGPIITWDDRATMIVFAVEADSEAHASQVGVEVVASALSAVSLQDHYPARVEVEVADERQLVGT